MTGPDATRADAADAADTDTEGEEDLFQRCYPLNVDSPHVAHLLESDDRVRFYLVDLSGLDSAGVAALLPVVQREMAGREVVPVFLTDLLEYRVLREAGVIFEALPPIAANSALMPGADWHSRREEVMALIRDKWNPAGEVSLVGDAQPGGGG